MKNGNCCGHCRQFMRFFPPGPLYWGCTATGNREIHDDDSAAMVKSEEGNQYLKSTSYFDVKPFYRLILKAFLLNRY